MKSQVNIDIETCDQRGGTVKLMACIEDPAVVKRGFWITSSNGSNPTQRPLIPLERRRRRLSELDLD